MTTGVRLRQSVLAATDLDMVAGRLREELGLGEPFHDPGVGAFGLRNAVFAMGDTFIEVVAPTQPDTAAGRYLERKGGDCGYMLIFQLDDLDAARVRVKEIGIRIVWQADMPDISGTHLHPADMRGAIVSLDRADPPGSWRWGGPDWTGAVGQGAPGRVVGVTVGVVDASSIASRWASVLGVDADAHRLELDDSFVSFDACSTEREEGLTEIAVEVPDSVRRGRDGVEIAGVRFSFA